MSNENIAKMINCVRKNMEKQLKYKLNDEQLDELRLTGRVGIPIDDFAPYLQKLVNYLHNSSHENCCWSISLNVISLDLEISLQGSTLLL